MLGEELSQEAKNLLVRLSNQEKIIKYAKLHFRRDSGLKFCFSDYKSLTELFKAIYDRNLAMGKAKRKQDEFEAHLAALERYKPRNPDYVTIREKLLINAKRIYDVREMIINAFNDKIFPLNPE